jgi:hypothetical protein
MKRRSVASALVLACAVVLSACGDQSSTSETTPVEDIPAAFTDRNSSGEDLANAWFELLSMTGAEEGEVVTTPEQVEAGMNLVSGYLDPAFKLIRATGQRYTAGNYVPLDIDEFEVSDVVVTEPRDDIRVLRYFLSEPGATAPDTGLVMGGEKAPRISVMRWNEELARWQMVSHANFNSAVAAICGQDPIPVTGEELITSPEDLALGTSLVEQWREITLGISKEKVRHPANQIQLADGQGWPAVDGKPIEWEPASAYEAANIGVTRNGDLLVASYDAVVDDLTMEGTEYRASVSPRLLTYLLNPEGKWELIALANFTVPQGIPEGVDCVPFAS